MKNKSGVVNGEWSMVNSRSSVTNCRSSVVRRLLSVVYQSNFWVKTIALVALLFSMPSLLIAQADSTQPHAVDMATTMRSNGKIYVVVAVLTIILFGLFFYLIRLDRKISKLEKE